jgi:hypothetical protein
MEGMDLEPALVLVFYMGNARIDAGAWGVPASPAAGLHFQIKELYWSVEGRWVPGLGLNLLWSVSSPHLWRQ